MKLKSFVIPLALATGLGAIQPAQAQSADQAAYQKNLAAYNAQCTGVTASNATLYQQCAAQKATLDSQKQKLSSAGGQTTSGQIPLQMRGGSHSAGGDD
ncbi:MAG: hypothetical protein ACLPL5_11715 [Stellaceae bacterium]|jgi:hypothetical protein